MSITLLEGDCRALLRTLPDESVHCVVTSPPYWGLRDYGVDGQLGLERSLGEHVDTMVEVFSEVRRVLRKDGTLWLNYGDSYATAPNGRSAADTKAAGSDDRTFRDKPFSTIGPVRPSGRRDGAAVMPAERKRDEFLKPKDLCGIPWRVAFALQADGWYLRQDIIWHKPNPMPESIRDRCTKAHEYLFLLAKSERYYFDVEAMKEPAVSTRGPGNKRGYDVTNQRPGENANLGGSIHKIGLRETRNRRSVWSVTTKPFKDAHFATFPPDLIEPCILAGSPAGGVVLDPFNGAGTTGLVCQQHGRSYIGLELNPEYLAITRRRLGLAPSREEMLA